MCLFFLLVSSPLYSGLFYILHLFNKVLWSTSQLYWPKYHTDQCKKKKKSFSEQRIFYLSFAIVISDFVKDKDDAVKFSKMVRKISPLLTQVFKGQIDTRCWWSQSPQVLWTKSYKALWALFSHVSILSAFTRPEDLWITPYSPVSFLMLRCTVQNSVIY